jgi:restriction system protein
MWFAANSPWRPARLRRSEFLEAEKAVRTMADWSDYQKQVAAFFREFGLKAETDVTVAGTRTKHAVDVVVDLTHVGMPVRWLVECKAWSRPVAKETILAHRMIVQDVGADRGLVMAEKGYQKGALEAAHLANIQLTSLADLRELNQFDLGMSRLKSLRRRVDDCRRRYWALGKDERIQAGLRQHAGAPDGYSGARVIATVDAALNVAFLDSFPVIVDEQQAVASLYSGARDFLRTEENFTAATPAELHTHLDSKVTELERRLCDAETTLDAEDQEKEG